MGSHDEAIDRAERARRLAERAGDAGLTGRALLALGRAESDAGRLRRARRLLEDARVRFESTGDLRGQGWALHRLSETWGWTELDAGAGRPPQRLQALHQGAGPVRPGGGVAGPRLHPVRGGRRGVPSLVRAGASARGGRRRPPIARRAAAHLGELLLLGRALHRGDGGRRAMPAARRRGGGPIHGGRRAGARCHGRCERRRSGRGGGARPRGRRDRPRARVRPDPGARPARDRASGGARGSSRRRGSRAPGGAGRDRRASGPGDARGPGGDRGDAGARPWPVGSGRTVRATARHSACGAIPMALWSPLAGADRGSSVARGGRCGGGASFARRRRRRGEERRRRRHARAGARVSRPGGAARGLVRRRRRRRSRRIPGSPPSSRRRRGSPHSCAPIIRRRSIRSMSRSIGGSRSAPPRGWRGPSPCVRRRSTGPATELGPPHRPTGRATRWMCSVCRPAVVRRSSRLWAAGCEAVPWVTCAGSSMDRASDYGSEGWGFDSLPRATSTNADSADPLAPSSAE